MSQSHHHGGSRLRRDEGRRRRAAWTFPTQWSALPGYDTETKNFNAEVHIMGTHVAEYMRH